MLRLLRGLWAYGLVQNCNLQNLCSISWDIAKCNRIPLLPSRWHEAQPAQPTRGTLKRDVETLQRTVHCLHRGFAVFCPCSVSPKSRSRRPSTAHWRSWSWATWSDGPTRPRVIPEIRMRFPGLSVDVNVLMSLILAWMKFENRIEIIK